MPFRSPVQDSRQSELSLSAVTAKPAEDEPPFWHHPFRRLRDNLGHLLMLIILGVGALGAVRVAEWLEDQGLEHWVALVIRGIAALMFVGQALLSGKHVALDFVRSWKER